MNVSLRSFSIYFKKVSLREDSHQQEYNAVKNSVYVCVEVGGWTLGGCLVVYNTTHFWFKFVFPVQYSTVPEYGNILCASYEKSQKPDEFSLEVQQKLSHQSYWEDDKPCLLLSF